MKRERVGGSLRNLVIDAVPWTVVIMTEPTVKNCSDVVRVVEIGVLIERY